MVFDENGFLVVAGAKEFCVFSAPNEVVSCYVKADPEPTENIIFDTEGNLYTTTSTGGTSIVRKYDKGFNSVKAFSLPSGNLTGITCDPQGNLYVASQTGGPSVIYKVDKVDFTVLDQFTVPGVAEGLQFASDGNMFVALQQSMGVARVKPSSPSEVLGSAKHPNLLFAVPVTTDNQGRIYTADYENGAGTAPADIFVFEPDGTLAASRLASEVYGPFGIVVAGAVLPCGAFKP
jgi:streptogramin lyase